jgi:hypothetical protein
MVDLTLSSSGAMSLRMTSRQILSRSPGIQDPCRRVVFIPGAKWADPAMHIVQHYVLFPTLTMGSFATHHSHLSHATDVHPSAPALSIPVLAQSGTAPRPSSGSPLESIDNPHSPSHRPVR